MVAGINVNYSDSLLRHQSLSLTQKPVFSQINRAELRQNFAPMTHYKMLLKGLACAFSWGELLLPPGEIVKQLRASRAIVKLSASTFTVPKLVGQTIELYDSANKVHLCAKNKSKNAQQMRKVIKAVAGLFLSSVGFTNKGSKVLLSLHKTQVIDLTQIADSALDYLDTISFVTSLPALYLSVLKLVSLVLRYREIEQGSDKKNDVLIKIALRSFKLFCSTLGVISYFTPALTLPRIVSLGLSTVSFTISLGKSIADSDWESSQAPIALKRGVV